MKAAIRQHALELGFDDCRVHHRRAADSRGAIPQMARGQAPRRDGLARAQRRQAHRPATRPRRRALRHHAGGELRPSGRRTRQPSRGVIARYARYADYHDALAQALGQLTERVQSLAGEDARSLWYVDTGPILERDLGQRAGLGFIGKHTNLISRRLGNWFFISEILTTAELEPDEPERNHCGKCTSCIDACPTGAITAPFQLDARRCISYLTIELKGSIPEEFRPAIGNRIYGCDDCLDACPWNRFAGEGRLMAPHRRDDLDQADLDRVAGAGRRRFPRQDFAAHRCSEPSAGACCETSVWRWATSATPAATPAARASRCRPRAADRRARPMGPWPSAAALRSELTALCPFFTGCNRTIEGYLLLSVTPKVTHLAGLFCVCCLVWSGPVTNAGQ